MKRFIYCLLTLFLMNIGQIQANVGLPFFVNYLPSDYQAHNRNFDVLADDKGYVYVANFEGVLYYDQENWHLIPSPGTSRVTNLYKDKDGKIWIGGYNLFGYLSAADNGELQLQMVYSRDSKGFLGEVTQISEKRGKVCVTSTLGPGFLEDDTMADFLVEAEDLGEPQYYKGAVVNQQVTLSDGTSLLATAGNGLVWLDRQGAEIKVFSKQKGLCNDNINAIYADSLGQVWGATDNGLFYVDLYSIYTSYNETDGLPGDVLSICQTPTDLYAGTLQGLYRKKDDSFELVGDIRQVCWQIQQRPDGTIYASTGGGVYTVKSQEVKQLTTAHTVSTYVMDDGSFYAGEEDGIYSVIKGVRRYVNVIEKNTCFFMDSDGLMWVRNIFGQVFYLPKDRSRYVLIRVEGENGEIETYNNTIFQQNGSIYLLSHIGLFVWDSKQKKMVPTKEKKIWSLDNQYSQLVYTRGDSCIWATNNEGKALTVYSDSLDTKKLNSTLYPFHTLTVQALSVSDREVWLGGSFGLIHWNTDDLELDKQEIPGLHIRRITMNGDSIVWGGFSGGECLQSEMPFKELTIKSGIHNLDIYFSTDAYSSIGKMEYSYRMERKEWSNWSTEALAHIAKPFPGKYVFEVRARDRYGRYTASIKMPVVIKYPVFLRWYCLVFYILLIVYSFTRLLKWRTRRLTKEKLRLEEIVVDRTSQLRKQKEEIEVKSKGLEVALNDLSKAQFELVRQERLATVGKLTKGLVDRILNPMNYINNFSHMSIDLIKDVKTDLDDDRENMTPDIYDDSMEVLEMLSGNLQKIEGHGVNASRILKAMEELLKDRKCNMAPTDLVKLCCKNVEVLSSYYAKDIETCHVKVEAPDVESFVVAEVDAEQFSKTIMSMLVNSIYAILKKYQHKAYDPVLRISVTTDPEEGKVSLHIYDNGIGIEESIIDRIFDPFFTTKTTTEAAGIGMYLSKEIILNHGGNVEVQSVKDEYTEFVITIPIRQDKGKEEK